MKKTLTIILMMALSIGLSNVMAQKPAQHTCSHGHSCGHCAHGKAQKAPCGAANSDISAEILRAFPTVKSVEKGKKGIEIYDCQHKLLGYALYSDETAKKIQGYAGPTPVMIALTPKRKVQSVQLLANNETPQYIDIVLKSKLLSSWNGLSTGKAKNKRVDAVSGATYSSRSIIETVRATLK